MAGDPWGSIRCDRPLHPDETGQQWTTTITKQAVKDAYNRLCWYHGPRDTRIKQTSLPWFLEYEEKIGHFRLFAPPPHNSEGGDAKTGVWLSIPRAILDAWAVDTNQTTHYHLTTHEYKKCKHPEPGKHTALRNTLQRKVEAQMARERQEKYEEQKRKPNETEKKLVDILDRFSFDLASMKSALRATYCALEDGQYQFTGGLEPWMQLRGDSEPVRWIRPENKAPIPNFTVYMVAWIQQFAVTVGKSPTDLRNEESMNLIRNWMTIFPGNPIDRKIPGRAWQMHVRIRDFDVWRVQVLSVLHARLVDLQPATELDPHWFAIGEFERSKLKIARAFLPHHR